VSLSFHTDNRLISRVAHSTEAARLVEAGFGWDELLHMGLEAARASFLPEAARRAAAAALQDWGSAEGLA
jgi:adenosine deaminase